MEPMLHSFGGSALDRHIFEFETVADGSAATAGAPAGDGPSQTDPVADPGTPAPEGATGVGESDSSSADATDTAPAWTPEQITALRNDPEFQAYVSEEASTIADARFQQLLAQANAANTGMPATGGDAGQVDLNQFLDPYGDNFGTNLATVLGGILQRVEQSLDQRFQPINEQAAQVQAAERDDLLKNVITETAQTLGGLKGGDAAVQRVMADVRNRYMPEAAQVYGNTDRAARHAIDRAIRAERDYQNAVAGSTAVDQNEHLATLAGGRTDLAAGGSGSGLVTLPDQPLSSRERVLKYAPQIQTARSN